jgi:hypothetical protein
LPVTRWQEAASHTVFDDRPFHVGATGPLPSPEPGQVSVAGTCGVQRIVMPGLLV